MEIDLVLEISLEGDQLVSMGSQMEKETLFHLGEQRFFIISKNATITFVPQAEDQMELIITADEGEIRGKRIGG